MLKKKKVYESGKQCDLKKKKIEYDKSLLRHQISYK